MGPSETRNQQTWLRLDNAAKIFPSIASDRLTHLFRLTVNLEDTVQPEILVRALHAVLPRFPSFRFRLKAGFFWYSLVEDPQLPPVFPESASPCLPFGRTPRELFRVRWFARRLAVEFSHSLTDGVGALPFFKALTAEYLTLTGVSSEDPENLRRVQTFADPAEGIDEFQKLYDPTFPRFETWNKAFQPASSLLPKGQYAATVGHLSLKQTLALCRSRNATLTEYLAATLLAAFQDGFRTMTPDQQRRRARPIRLVVPINLRPIFRSKTLRNFFVVVPVEIDLRLGIYDFDEILRKVHHQLQAEMDAKLLKKQIMRNLRGELNPVARMLPLPIKALILKSVFGAYERRHTTSLSNLGSVSWPDGWSKKIRSVEFTPPPSPFCRTNVGVVSCGETLSITIGSLSADSSVEWAFFTRLLHQGLSVSIQSNREFLEV